MKKRSEVGSARPTTPRLELKQIRVDQCDPSRSQPHTRTTATAIQSLLRLVEEDGRIKDPIAVIRGKGGRYIIANGHRRIAVAKALGIEMIWCIIHHGVTEENLPMLWADLSHAKVINSQNWAESWFRCEGAHERRMPPGTRANLNAMVKIWGYETAKDLVLNKTVSPNVVHCLQQVRIRLAQVPSAGSFSDRQIGDWLINHRMQNTVNSLFNGAGKVPSDIVRKMGACIKSGRPFNPFATKLAQAG